MTEKGAGVTEKGAGDEARPGTPRDALLSKLVSGELRIRDVEQIIGRCA
ncbi:MAG: hypothetical protein HRF50_18240 [Phycisphaerae bacterium]